MKLLVAYACAEAHSIATAVSCRVVGVLYSFMAPLRADGCHGGSLNRDGERLSNRTKSFIIQSHTSTHDGDISTGMYHVVCNVVISALSSLIALAGFFLDGAPIGYGYLCNDPGRPNI